jgi:hypothetical protein
MALWPLVVAAAVYPAVAACSGSFPCTLNGVPLYKIADQTVDARVSDLLSRMTLSEKVAQMLNPVEASYEYFAANYSSTSIGTIYSGLGGDSCNAAGPHGCQNAIQALFLNSSRLGIPASFIGETLHSAGCSGGTIFPVPVLLGATFNVALISRIGTSIARQARSCGIDRGLSPVLQVDTDPRFGRFEESYGEDPFLVSTMGVAMVRVVVDEHSLFIFSATYSVFIVGHRAPRERAGAQLVHQRHGGIVQESMPAYLSLLFPLRFLAALCM